MSTKVATKQGEGRQPLKRGFPAGRKHTPAAVRARILERLMAGERAQSLAEEYGLTPQGIYAIGYAVGIKQAGRTPRIASKQDMLRQLCADAVNRRLATPAGKIIAAFAETLDPVIWKVSRAGRSLAPIRATDGVRISVLQPRVAKRPSPVYESAYCGADIAADRVALVALPDGEVFVVEPSPRKRRLAFSSNPISNNRILARAKHATFHVAELPSTS